MQFFDELIEAWRYTREGVIAEVKNFPDSAFDQMPGSLKRSALDLVNHIVESGRLMAGELSRPDGDFLRKSYGALMAEHTRPGDVAKSKAEAVALLERSHAEGEATLKGAGEAHMAKPIRQFNGVPASRRMSERRAAIVMEVITDHVQSGALFGFRDGPDVTRLFDEDDHND